MVHTPLPEDSALLILADGTVFKGKAAGSRGTSFGEIAFNTGMYGYQEIFTDPSYHKQIVVMATAHVGNYGVHEDDTESDGRCRMIWKGTKLWASATWTHALW